MKTQVNRHNDKIQRNRNKATKKQKPSPSCNCLVLATRGGSQATIEKKKGKKQTNVGLACKFKKRFYKERENMENQSQENSTTLSTHFWNEMEN